MCVKLLTFRAEPSLVQYGSPAVICGHLFSVWDLMSQRNAVIDADQTLTPLLPPPPCPAILTRSSHCPEVGVCQPQRCCMCQVPMVVSIHDQCVLLFSEV